jgi:protocatechuate 3,4-dioxygenase beta subunit
LLTHTFTVEIKPEETGKLHVSGLKLGIVKKLKITGSVFNDLNANGAFNSAGANPDIKMQTSTIHIERTSGGDGTEIDNPSVTAASGDYSFETWPGTYTVAFPTASGAYSISGSTADANSTDYANYLTVKKNGGGFVRSTRTYTLSNLTESRSGINLALTRPRTMKGVVWHDADGNAAINITPDEYISGGRSLTIAAVSGLAATPSSNTTSSNGTTGAYDFSGLYPGTYTVTADLTTPMYKVTNYGSSLGYNGALTTGGVYTFTIPSEDTGITNDVQDINFGLAKPVKIGGFVWQDKEMDLSANYVLNGVYDSATDSGYVQTGIAKLYKWDPSDGAYKPWNGTAFGTDANALKANAQSGMYYFANQLPGNYQVVLTPNADYFVTGPSASRSIVNPTAGNGNATFTMTGDTVGTWENIVMYSGDSLDGDIVPAHIPSLDLAVGKYITISGVIYHDLDGNGQKGGSGESNFITNPEQTVTLLRDSSHTATPNYEIEKANQSAVNGAYSFTVKPGKYRVLYQQNEYKITNVAASGLTVSVDNGNPSNSTAAYENAAYITGTQGNIADKDFLLSVYSQISGDVWLDKNANAIFDTSPAEDAMAGAKVVLDYTSGGPNETWFTNDYPSADKTKTIGASGEYAFENLWPGTYTVTLINGNGNNPDISRYIRTNTINKTGMSEVSEWTWQVVVTSDNHGDTTDINFGLIKPSSIQGIVWHDADNSKEKDESETATTPNVSVVRTATGNMKPYTHTGTTGGAFNLTELLPGEYTFSANLAASWLRTYLAEASAVSSNPAGSVTVAPHATDTNKFIVTITDGTGNGVAAANIMAGYAQPSIIEGVIYYDTNNSGSKDPEETDLNGMIATLTSTTDPSFTQQTQTTAVANGSKFSFGNLLPGTYELVITGDISSYLVTTIEGATVGTAPEATGAFSKAAKKWTITIPSDDQSISLQTGVITPRSISGTVWHDIDGNGAYNASLDQYFSSPKVKVELYKDYGTMNEVKTGQMDASDSNGGYKFENLYPGNYTVVVMKPSSDYYPANTGSVHDTTAVTRDVTVTNADITGENFALSRKISITGSVWQDKDAGGANGKYDEGVDTILGGAAVTLNHGESDETTVNADSITGIYTFSDLEPGTYTVSLVDPAYADYALTNSMDTADTAFDAKHIGEAVSFNPSGRTWTVTRYDGHNQKIIDFAISPKSSLYVKVWTDTNGDGMEDQYEPIRQGTTVNLYLSGDDGSTYPDIPAKTLTTDSNEYMVFADLAIGYYKVEVVPQTDCGVTNTADNATYQYIHNDKHGRTHEREFGMVQYVTFSGQVWTEMDGDGVYNSINSTETVQAHGFALYRNDVLLPGFTTTLADGTFTITAADKILPGRFKLVFADQTEHLVTNTAKGFVPKDRKWEFTLTDGQDKDDIRCGFTPMRTIKGYVWLDDDLSRDKEPGEDYLLTETVTLYVKGADGHYAPVSGYENVPISQATNTFEFSGLYPGEYRVGVDTAREEYLRTNPPAGQNETCYYAEYSFGESDTPATTTKEDKIGLVASAVISGFAYLDKNSSDAYEAGIDAYMVVKVIVKKLSGGLPVHTYPAFSTNPDGTYDTQHLNLLPGDYSVEFEEVQDHAVCTNANTEFDAALREWTFSLVPGEKREDADIGYKRAYYIIRGSVFNDMDADGIKSDSEPWFSASDGIVMTASHSGTNTHYSEMVDDDGNYEMKVYHPGDYVLKAILPSGYVVTLRTSVYDAEKDEFSAVLTYEQNEARVDFGAVKTIRITGMMWMDLNANGFYEPTLGETVLRNAQIQLKSLDKDGHVEATASTDDNGWYEFSAVKPGRYTVQLASLPGSNPFYTGYKGTDAPDTAVSAFNLRNGQWNMTLTTFDVLNANSGYHDPSTISGILLNEDTQKPVPGQKVELQKKNENGEYATWDETVTDIDGYYEFGLLTVGEYRIIMTIPAGYSKNDTSSGMQSGDTVVIDTAISVMGEGQENEVCISRLEAHKDKDKNEDKDKDKNEDKDKNKDQDKDKDKDKNKAEEKNKSDGPHTGDDYSLFVWLVILAGAAICTMVLLSALKKKQPDES